MLYRKVQKDIEKWLNDGHDALLITGARQVGKSFLIRETLKRTKLIMWSLILFKIPIY